MKCINFVGNVDKKILTLPLARGLRWLGDTLIVTDDTSYKRLLLEDGTTMNGIKIIMVDEKDIDIEFVEAYDDGVDYLNVIFDTTSKVIDRADKIVVCRNKDRALIPSSVTELTDVTDLDGDPEVQSREVIITAAYKKQEEKKKHFRDRYGEAKDRADLIELKLVHYKWLSLSEEKKDIDVLKEPTTMKFIAGISYDMMGKTEKTMEELLSRVV